jgi:hypothetical protein
MIGVHNQAFSETHAISFSERNCCRRFDCRWEDLRRQDPYGDSQPTEGTSCPWLCVEYRAALEVGPARSSSANQERKSSHKSSVAQETKRPPTPLSLWA